MPDGEKYPLEQLVVIKQKKLEEAEKVLAEKKRELLKEEEKLKTVEKERDKVKEHRQNKLQQLRDALDEGTTSDKIQQMKQYLKTVDEKLADAQHKVKQQQKQVDTAKANVETARQDLFKKQQDVEKLKTHHKEWEKEMKAAMEQKEAVESDEIGSAVHHLRKRSKNHPHKKGK
jgi:flagellar biosynthesis chaperone FliJ